MEETDSKKGFLSGVKETTFVLGGCLFLTSLAIGAIGLLLMLLRGTPWISENFYPWTVQAEKIALFFVVPTCSVLAFFRKGRSIGGLGLLLSSYIIGFSLWLWSLIVAYTLGGVFWMIVGLLFVGVGVIPIAIVAAALNAQWAVAGQMLISIIVVHTLRIVGDLLIKGDSQGGELK